MPSDAPHPVLVRLSDLPALSAEARASRRLRKNRNLHEMADPVHRLLNAIEPGSYVRPHRHLHPPKAETLVVLSGALGLLAFDDGGKLLDAVRLEAGGENTGVDLPAGSWHSFVALEPGTVFLETKAGPYIAPTGDDAAAWAPAEDDPGAEGLEAGWRALFAPGAPPAR